MTGLDPRGDGGLGDQAGLHQLRGVLADDRGMVRDAGIKLRLREAWLVDLVVAVAGGSRPGR